MNNIKSLSDDDLITQKIIGAAYEVSNNLGCGFLEKVYENALCLELKEIGLKYSNQSPVKVFYRNSVVGEYVADIIVEDRIIVELKALRRLEESHYSQCLNYLKATRLRLGLLLNFGQPRVQVKRLINDHL